MWDFSDLFIEIEELKKAQNYTGNLGAIYYNNPENSQGNIKAFLGVILVNDIFNIPSGFEKIELNSTEVIEGSLKASNAFGISVNKVYKAIFKFANENNLTLEDYYIEWFPNKDEIIVQIKIKQWIND